MEYAVADVDSITFAKKENIVVKAKVPESWGTDIYVYIWETQDVSTGDYRAVKQGDWYVYTYAGKELNIIFKQGKGWKGDKYQTEDIHATKSACYQLMQEDEKKAVAIQINCGN